MRAKLLLFNLCIQFVVFGQVQNQFVSGQKSNQPTLKNGFPSGKTKVIVPPKATVLFSNDFISPGQWSFSNSSSPNTDWQITSNLILAPLAAFRPAGFFTAFNGYAIIDSDAQGPSASQDAVLSLNQHISVCANEPNVLLRFSQMYRKFNDTTTLEVSNDGTTWTQFIVNANKVNNTNSTNPESVTVNISSVAGNQDSVYLRFRYRANNAWFWALDDIQLLRQDKYDLASEELNYGNVGNWGTKLAYSMIPVQQIQPIEVSGRVRNIGFAGQIGVKLIGESIGFSAQSTTNILPPNLAATYDLNQGWLPTNTLGIKSLGLRVESDSIDAEPTNNFFDSLKIEITQDIYARDKRVQEGRVANSFFTQGYEVGSVFDMYADQTLTSAQVFVLSETTANTTLFVKIYEAIDNNTFNYLSGSDTLVIPASNQSKWFRVRMRNPELLQNGKSYLLVAGSEGSPVFPGLVIGTAGLSEFFTTFQSFGSVQDWYSFTEIPMIRMSFESVVSTTEIFSEPPDFEIFPNPTSHLLNIRFASNEKESFEVKITDYLGRIVSTTFCDGNSYVDVSHLSPGIYAVCVLNSTGEKTKRFVKI